MPEPTPQAEYLGDDPTLASETDPEPGASGKGVIALLGVPDGPGHGVQLPEADS